MKKLLSLTLITIALSTTTFANTKKINPKKVEKKQEEKHEECEGMTVGFKECMEAIQAEERAKAIRKFFGL